MVISSSPISFFATGLRPVRLALAAVAATTFLAGCASAPSNGNGETPVIAAAAAAAATAATDATAAASPAAAPGSAVRPPAPAVAAAAAAAAAAMAQSAKPFADVVKDAHETPGLFRVWQKDDKVWLEIAPNQ